jgi:hypothetical protein
MARNFSRQPKTKPVRTDTCAACGGTFYAGNEGVPCKQPTCEKATCGDHCRSTHAKSHRKVTNAES